MFWSRKYLTANLFMHFSFEIKISENETKYIGENNIIYICDCEINKIVNRIFIELA